MTELELHDEVVEWMVSLDATEWNRTVVVIDRLVGADAVLTEPRRRALRAAVHARPDRTTVRLPVHQDGRIVLLTTFRKRRNNERNEIDRARKAAEDCAKRYP